MGMVRAKQDRIDPPGSFPVLPLLIHGDAAFSGQGVVAECLAMSDTGGYRIGGTIHLIINNQIGFTTAPGNARSSPYCSDVAKTVQAPIFHVNADDPEACVRVAQLAWEYRQTFNKDVVIDMVCYRRHGHNEGDDPSYTQPLMYKAIADRRSVRKLYVESLVKRGDITLDEAEQALTDFHDKLQVGARRDARAGGSRRGEMHRAATAVEGSGVLPQPPHRRSTGATLDDIVYAALTSTDYPEGLHECTPSWRSSSPPAGRRCTRVRRDRLGAGRSAGHTAALVLEGRDQCGCAGRGHAARHVQPSARNALIDYETGRRATCHSTMLAGVDDALSFWVYDSLAFSEYAALGFEYGYRHRQPEGCPRGLWEAQFGDFANGAQVIIDQYIVAAEGQVGSRTERASCCCCRTATRGRGPSTASARIERFLTLLAAEDNMSDRATRRRRASFFPPAPSSGASRTPDAVDRVHPQVGAANEADPLVDRRADHGLFPGGAR